MIDLLSLLMFMAAPPDMSGEIAVHAAYVIHTTSVNDPLVDRKCCAECGGTGKIVQGDGHDNPCPCPSDCECKAVKHPPVLIRQNCKGGSCSQKKP